MHQIQQMHDRLTIAMQNKLVAKVTRETSLKCNWWVSDFNNAVRIYFARICLSIRGTCRKLKKIYRNP